MTSNLTRHAPPRYCSRTLLSSICHLAREDNAFHSTRSRCSLLISLYSLIVSRFVSYIALSRWHICSWPLSVDPVMANAHHTTVHMYVTEKLNSAISHTHAYSIFIRSCIKFHYDSFIFKWSPIFGESGEKKSCEGLNDTG